MIIFSHRQSPSLKIMFFFLEQVRKISENFKIKEADIPEMDITKNKNP
jgi:hypothetical protein